MRLHTRTIPLIVLAMAFLSLAAARDARAQAQMNVTVTPNNFSIAAGSTQTITVTTQSNANTPASATSVTYNLQITPDFNGGSTTITTNTPQTSTRGGTPPNDWTPVTIQITVPANAVPGNYSGPLTGHYQYAPGQFTDFEFAIVNLTVTSSGPQPDFAVTATPSSITLSPGGSTQVMFTASGSNGFNGPITVNVPPLPNVTISPSPQFTITPGQTVPVTFTASASATSGTNTANFGATATINGGTVNHLVPVSVTVQAPQPDFTLNAVPSTITVTPGASQPVAVTLQPLNGFSSTVTVNATSARNDISIAPATFTLTAGQTQNVTITASPTAQSGFAGVTFSAASHQANVTVNVLPPANPADFTITATAPAQPLLPGSTAPIAFRITPSNNFNAPVQIAAPSLPNLTFSPNPLMLAAGALAGTMNVMVATTAQAGALPVTFTATSGTLLHTTAPVILTIAAPPANQPAITSVTPPSIVRGTTGAVLRVAGTNFQRGAQVSIDAAGVTVRSTNVLSAQFADVTVDVSNSADLRRAYTLRLTNPNNPVPSNGLPLFLYDQDAIGAPLSVRAAAIEFPAEGTLVAGTDTVVPRGLVATTGSGILHGQWRIDGIAYESFDVQATAGLPVRVTGRVRVPALSWGDHELTLAVATKLDDLALNTNAVAVSPAVTLISTIETATRLTIFAPPDRAIIGREVPTFRWSLVPGASGYVVEFGTRVNAAQLRISTADSTWTPTPDQLAAIRKISGIVLWRVRAVFPGDVAGEPTPQRAIVILPPHVMLRGTPTSGAAQWSGGSDGVIYRIEVSGDRGKLFSAIAFHPHYRVPRFARARATALYITPVTPNGEALGPMIAITLPPANAAADATAPAKNVTVTPPNGGTVDTTQPRITATWSGDVPAAQVTLFVDDTDVTPVSTVTPASITYDSLLPLAAGAHTAKLAAGSAAMTWSFTVGASATAVPAAPVVATAAPATHTDYTLAPNGTITWLHDGKNDAHAHLSGQGDLEEPNGLGTKFTGDLAYHGMQNPQSVRQESRNYVAQGSAKQGSLSEEAKFGYTTPDFTNGAEFLTSGLARIGVAGRVSLGYGTVSYYQPVNTAIYGVLSGNNLNLRIRSAGFATPDGKPWQLRAIALQVDDPGQAQSAGSRMRTYGVFGNWNVSNALQLTAEAAHGTQRPDCGSLTDIAGSICPTTSRNGNAFRLGMTGVVAQTTTYGLMLRHVDANFVNPANRGLTMGGVSDRTSADLNLGRQFGTTGVNLMLRRQEGGRSHDSTSPRASQSGANLSINRMLGQHLNASLSAMLSQDRSAALAASSFNLPATHRDQSGANGTLTEMFGRGYALSETLGWQRMLDHVNTLMNQRSSNANLTFAGSPLANLTLSANAGATRTAGSPTLGTTTQYLVSFQPSIAVPKMFLSFAPRVGYNHSSTDVTHSTSSGAQYAAILQFSPAWASSLVSGQLSAEWNANDASMPLTTTHQWGRRYQASMNIRWGGLHSGAATTVPSLLPGATPQPPPVAQAAAPAASH